MPPWFGPMRPEKRSRSVHHAPLVVCQALAAILALEVLHAPSCRGLVDDARITWGPEMVLASLWPDNENH